MTMPEASNGAAASAARWRRVLLGWPGLIALGLALILTGAAILRWGAPSDKHADKLSADRDPAAILAAVYPDLQERPQALRQWAGRVLVVNFWATWCGPCREEIPDLIQLHARFSGDPVTIVGLAIDQAEPVRSFVQEFGVPYPVLIAGFGGVDLARSGGNIYGVLPFTVVIDRQGKIAAAQLGRVPTARLEEWVRGAL